MLNRSAGFRNWVAEITHSTRYGIVKVISPTLYKRNKDDIEGTNARSTIRFVRDIMGNNRLVGAEIGVAAGINAESILKSLNMKRLYLVDPYESYLEDSVAVPSHLRFFGDAQERLKRFENEVQFLRLTSAEAARLIPEHLDFVYIDGNHDYEYVKQDIANYYPKVKEKGVIGGHDFCKDYLGVIRAVTEFAVSSSLLLMVHNDDWWVQKGLI